MDILNDIFLRIMDIQQWKLDLNVSLENIEKNLCLLPPSGEVEEIKKELDWLRDQFSSHNSHP